MGKDKTRLRTLSAWLEVPQACPVHESAQLVPHTSHVGVDCLAAGTTSEGQQLRRPRCRPPPRQTKKKKKKKEKEKKHLWACYQHQSEAPFFVTEGSACCLTALQRGRHRDGAVCCGSLVGIRCDLIQNNRKKKKKKYASFGFEKSVLQNP